MASGPPSKTLLDLIAKYGAGGPPRFKQDYYVFWSEQVRRGVSVPPDFTPLPGKLNVPPIAFQPGSGRYLEFWAKRVRQGYRPPADLEHNARQWRLLSASKPAARPARKKSMARGRRKSRSRSRVKSKGKRGIRSWRPRSRPRPQPRRRGGAEEMTWFEYWKTYSNHGHP
jgi:hypothetical protein